MSSKYSKNTIPQFHILALIWIVFLQARIPGNWIIQGVIYGTLISLIAGLLISPIVMRAAGDSVGIFYSDSWFPGKILLAGYLMHVGYGVVLTLCLNYSGVYGIEKL